MYVGLLLQYWVLVGFKFGVFVVTHDTEKVIFVYRSPTGSQNND